MQITLKNGETIKLEWNWLVVERIEETVGSLDNLNEKKTLKRGGAKTAGDVVYAVVQSALDKEYKRNELLKLVEIDDFEDILNFVRKQDDKTKKTVGVSDTKK